MPLPTSRTTSFFATTTQRVPTTRLLHPVQLRVRHRSHQSTEKLQVQDCVGSTAALQHKNAHYYFGRFRSVSSVSNALSGTTDAPVELIRTDSDPCCDTGSLVDESSESVPALSEADPSCGEDGCCCEMAPLGLSMGAGLVLNLQEDRDWERSVCGPHAVQYEWRCCAAAPCIGRQGILNPAPHHTHRCQSDQALQRSALGFMKLADETTLQLKCRKRCLH